jgi:hypothetical protein
MEDETKAYYGNPMLIRQGEKIRAREKAEISPKIAEIAEMIAGFHPVLGPALSAKDFEMARREGSLAGMGLASLGMVPLAGGVIKPISKVAKTGYEALKETPDVVNFFKTSRGSTYAHHANYTTTRNRSGAAHADPTEGIQPRSGRTVFIDPKDVNRLGGVFQNPEIATQIVQKLDASGKATGKGILQLTEDFGPRKAGSVLYEFPYSLHPQVGLNPMEIYNSHSPIGNAGTGIHFGTEIKEVIPATVAKKYGGEIKMPEQYSKGRWTLI